MLKIHSIPRLIRSSECLSENRSRELGRLSFSATRMRRRGWREWTAENWARYDCRGLGYTSDLGDKGWRSSEDLTFMTHPALLKRL
jgi:hypothetical protein